MRWLLAAMLVAAACRPRPAGPRETWRPVADSETIVVDGDETYRVTSTGDLELTAVVTLGEASAVGTAVLRTPRPDAAMATRHVGLARARAWYALPERLQADPARSYEAAHAGLDALGDDFVPRRWKDDTVFLVTIAEDKFPTQPAAAAEEMRGILAGRLRTYTIRWHAEVL